MQLDGSFSNRNTAYFDGLHAQFQDSSTVDDSGTCEDPDTEAVKQLATVSVEDLAGFIVESGDRKEPVGGKTVAAILSSEEPVQKMQFSFPLFAYCLPGSRVGLSFGTRHVWPMVYVLFLGRLCSIFGMSPTLAPVPFFLRGLLLSGPQNEVHVNPLPPLLYGSAPRTLTPPYPVPIPALDRLVLASCPDPQPSGRRDADA